MTYNIYKSYSVWTVDEQDERGRDGNCPEC